MWFNIYLSLFPQITDRLLPYYMVLQPWISYSSNPSKTIADVDGFHVVPCTFLAPMQTVKLICSGWFLNPRRNACHSFLFFTGVSYMNIHLNKKLKWYIHIQRNSNDWMFDTVSGSWDCEGSCSTSYWVILKKYCNMYRLLAWWFCHELDCVGISWHDKCISLAQVWLTICGMLSNISL